MICEKCGKEYHDETQPCPYCAAAEAAAGKSPYEIDPLASSGAIDARGPGTAEGRWQGAGTFVAAGASGAAASRNPFRRYAAALRRRSWRAIGLTALVVAVVAIVVVWFCVQESRRNMVSDEFVVQTLAEDSSFMAGTASTMFVTVEPYTLESVKIESKEVVEGGVVDVRATTEIRNKYFDEKSDVTVRFENDGSAWNHTVAVNARSVEAIRGISNDADYGIENANPTFDAEGQTCSLEQDYSTQGATRWFCTTTGSVKLAYAFANNEWTRTFADDSGLVTTFQPIVGTYADTAPDDGAGPCFRSFTIESVDDASGTARGTFEWTLDGSSNWGGPNARGSFAASVGKDGSLIASSLGGAATLTFAGEFGQSGVLKISGTVYYDRGFSLFGLGVEKHAFTDTVLVRQGY